MGLQLDAIAPGAGAPLLLVMPILLGVCSAWFGYRKARTIEQWRTARLMAALDGAAPANRPEILKALAFVEREHTDSTISGTPCQSPDSPHPPVKAQASGRKIPL